MSGLLFFFFSFLLQTVFLFTLLRMMPMFPLFSLLLMRVMMSMFLLLRLFSLFLRSVLLLLLLFLLLLLRLIRHQRRERGCSQLRVRFGRFCCRFRSLIFAFLRPRSGLLLLFFLLLLLVFIITLPLTGSLLSYKLHLLEQGIAIGLVPSFNRMHGLVVHQPHFAVGHHEQPRVVAHNHHAALELVDGLAERIDRLDISTLEREKRFYKWLVGSSKSRMCGWLSEISAKVTRAFCPPERFRIAMVCAWPSSP